MAFWSWVWLASLLPGFAGNVEVTVGEARITLLAPAGFVPVALDMTNVNRFLDSRVAPGNLRLASFVSESDAASNLQETFPGSQKLLSVQILKSSAANSFSAAEFDGIREALQKQNDAAVQRLGHKFSGALAALSNDVHSALQVNPGLRSIRSIALPVHSDISNAVAFSSVVNFTSQRADGVLENRAGVVTATLVHVKNKILYLYAYGGESDLQWSRAVSTA